ncbi:MFS general substrate transporter [Rhizophagus clarus]|uniref:MFS general substrate transporter n=1 Tax=Rhizophagus clarus TaxID=94130 RepID=A0A8H3ME43_9GLOM|nr:MFS general substrate transporter [Rhizophagus clarus]
MSDSKDGTTVTDTDEKFVEDKEFEKKLVRKMDFRIMPLLILLYFLAFLDRVNIGNAKLTTMEKDLGLVGTEFNWALSIFFIGYISFEVPSNIALIKTSAYLWIAFIMFTWGVMVILIAFVKNFGGLLVVRFFVGACEAGLAPGAVYYLATWYKRSELNARIAYCSIGNSFAGSFSGLLAFSLIKLEGKLNLKGWQWLFLVEGLISVIVAIAAYFFISDYPEKSRWLTDKERKYATERLKHDIGKAHILHYDRAYIYAAFTDYKVYLAMLQLFVASISVSSYQLFLPSIVNGMGFNYVISQLFSIPPFFCAGVSTIIVAIISDRKRVRGPIMILTSIIGILGYILLIIPSLSVPAKYVGACIVGTGLVPAVTTAVAWIANNIAGHAKRGITAGMVLMSANIGGIIASQIYRQKDYPNYTFGNSIALGCLVIATCIAVLQYFIYKTLNERKRKNPQSFLQGKSEEEIKNLGDLHPDFMYVL